MKLFSKLLGRSDRTRKAGPMPPHQVDHPIYVIGDVHGRMDLLDSLSAKIVEDAISRPGMSEAKVIYLGDYVDRGDQSAQVLAHLYELSLSQPDRHICLKGNHEVLMLNFLEDPRKHGARWLRYGGMQTLASFGIRGFHERMDVEDMPDIAAQLEDVLPDGMHDWLRGLPQTYRTGNVVCVHAALNPERVWNDQSDRTRMWGHKDFFTKQRTDGQWVAHGHTIMEQPVVDQGRMSLDTGAYATGRLTAMGLQGGDGWLVQVGG